MDNHAETPLPDAIDMLIEDHQRVQALLREIDEADTAGGGMQSPMAALACAELQIHAALEQEIFYPAVRGVLGSDAMSDAEFDLSYVASLLADLEQCPPDDPGYRRMWQALVQCVNNHVESERQQVFPRLRRTDLDLHGVAADMRARRRRLVESNGRSRRNGRLCKVPSPPAPPAAG